jgi:hypothetical protein
MDLFPGYRFHPSLYSPALGHPRVDIYLTSEPVGRFFDTYQVSFPVSQAGDIKELKIEHPWEEWMGGHEAKVVAGRFHLREKDADAHVGFSLGGEISIQNLGEATLCTLISSAPIFNLSDDPDSLSVGITNEIEGLLARREAAWGENGSGYTQKLAEADPLSLFIVIIHTLEQEIQNLPAAVRSHGYQSIVHRLKQARQTLEEAALWPEQIPDIQEIL